MHGNAFKWTPEIEAEALEHIANGKSVRAALQGDNMPSWDTFRKHLIADADFAARYARAREAQADKLFDECLTIADSQADDVQIVDGVEQVNHDVIARAKLRIDTRKWMAGKLRPKVYGDKLAIGGADDLPPISTINPTALSAAAMREILEAMDATPKADEG
jgi:hypothetical protein